ncbi:M23 family metallopeptidase [Cytobacillus gottheilii]|uniref:M23 family metallopeptidase n=1 Tax=Cytobacillus gottheilii TaxID=859144 RepID=UPI000836E7FD|nr:M23 family metallopeptidase [Cytobacillus gottheilii]
MREEEKKRSSQDSSFKRFLKKRWAFPAIYIASAAIILSAVLWYQNSSDSAIESDEFDHEATDITGKTEEPAIEVTNSLEDFKMPVADEDTAVIQTQFYDHSADTADQEAALIVYNNIYHPSTGIDIAMKDGETFDVLASLSGTVTKVEEDRTLGNKIEIEHTEGIVTQYQSVTEMNVEVGDQVKQGDVLAKAGQSLFNEDAGVHVHFEIRKDGQAVNPHEYFNKSLSALQEADLSGDTEAADNEDGSEESSAPEGDEEAKPEDGEKTAPEDGSAPEEGTETAPGEDSTTNPNDQAEDEGTSDEETDTEGGSEEEGDHTGDHSEEDSANA